MALSNKRHCLVNSFPEKLSELDEQTIFSFEQALLFLLPNTEFKKLIRVRQRERPLKV